MDPDARPTAPSSAPSAGAPDAAPDAATSPEVAPLRLERTLSRRLWGGSRLEGFLGLEPDPASGGRAGPRLDPWGESWQVWAGNRVTGGAWDGRTLQEVADVLGEGLLGGAAVARYGSAVPLLAKFLDAGDRLSIQVHPDDAYAREREAATGHLGKAEAWYVLEAEPGAEVLWGWTRDVTPEEVRSAVEGATLERLVNRVPVRAGDVIYNPAGTVHAIGAGILLFEIQQSSDLTYRLYDYGRRGADGAPRELHVDKSLDVADLSGGERARVAPRDLGGGRRELVATEHFVMEGIELDGRIALSTTPASLEILTCPRGAAALEAAGGRWTLERGDSLVLPAALGPYALEGRAEILRCYLPDA